MIDLADAAEGLLVVGVGLVAIAHTDHQPMLYWLAVGSLMMAAAAVEKRGGWLSLLL